MKPEQANAAYRASRSGRFGSFDLQRMKSKTRTIFWVFLAGAVIVVVVLPFLPRVGSHPAEPRSQTQMMLRIWQNAIDAYKLNCGTYPSDSLGLRALLVNPGVSNWQGPYYDTDSLGGNMTDGWGTHIKYFVTAAEPHIISAGPDKIFGTADDISASNPAFHAIGASAPQHER